MMRVDEEAIRVALDRYCNAVRRIRQDPSHHPETSLYSALEALVGNLTDVLGHCVQVIPQYSQSEIGAPDFGVRPSNLAAAFIEAKPPDRDITRLTGRDRTQLERYMRLSNLLYTNYWELCLYQEGCPIASAELVPRDALEPRATRVQDLLRHHNIIPAISLLERFLTFEIPSITSPEDLARQLARAAWLVRDSVCEAMASWPDDNPLQQIYQEFKDVLFYSLEPPEFADAYAQTLAYGLLLARQTTEDTITMENIVGFVDAEHHRLLAATLRLLSQPPVIQMVGWTIENLVAIVNQVSAEVLSESVDERDPLLYFYEDFLEVYDPELRKSRGVYYTPPQVVNLQTRAINHILVHDFERPYGFADESVKTLDPAVGTGTYLISALKEGCKRVGEAMGSSSVPDAAASMAARLHGFEVLVGPYTVARFRMVSAIAEQGGELRVPLPVLLTDTLQPASDEPNIQSHFGFMSVPLTEERGRADRVKRQTPIMVILGNPPYRRAKADSGWVWDVLLETFREPVRGAYGIDLKNLADPYVWFYRWAVWKLFEAPSAPAGSVLSFISNSRWILGGAFGGMRQVFRSSFDRIYVIDLHGDNRAPLPADVSEDQNIFDIQVGVAISICVADGSRSGAAAEVYYYGDTWGSRETKYDWLDQVAADLSNIEFDVVDGSLTDPFYPGLSHRFRSWPCLKDDVFVFSHSGVQTKRDHLVVAPTRASLRDKIERFLRLENSQRSDTFHNTQSKQAAAVATHAYAPGCVIEYGYRPLDIQYLYNHAAFLDRPRPELQRVWGHSNICLVTLPSRHGAGPVVFLHSHLPDICAFRGSYTSRVFPLWNNCNGGGEQQSLVSGRQHNLNASILEGLSQFWGQDVTPEDLFAYCYAVLSAPSYSFEFSRDLARSFPRIPLPTTARTFREGTCLGEQLMRLHSFDERYPGDGSIQINGRPDEIVSIDYNNSEQRVYLAPGSSVGPVAPEVWAYSVSGYQVLRQWISRRREVPFELGLRQQLLDAIWIVQRTVELSADLDDLLNRLLEGETLVCTELGLENQT